MPDLKLVDSSGNDVSGNDIRMYRLVSGEYVLGNVVGEQSEEGGDKTIIFEHPMSVMVMPQPGQKSMGIAMEPLNVFGMQPGNSGKVPIKESHIMFPIESPPDQIVDKYLSTTSGITIARAMPPPPKA